MNQETFDEMVERYKDLRLQGCTVRDEIRDEMYSISHVEAFGAIVHSYKEPDEIAPFIDDDRCVDFKSAIREAGATAVWIEVMEETDGEL